MHAWTMSITGAQNQYKKSFHSRNDSDELDVFEAARYFSGFNEGPIHERSNSHQKLITEDRLVSRTARMSLDMPAKNSFHSQNLMMEKQMKEKKNRQPSSPGGRLAHFLNSLFNQTYLKRKKQKSGLQSVKDEQQSPRGRRQRRSSISHFHYATDSKSSYSSRTSGFRTPPPHANTPIKSYKDFTSFSDHKQVISVQKYSDNFKSTALHGEKRSTNSAWSEEKLKASNALPEQDLKNNKVGFAEKNRIINWIEEYPSEEKEFRKFSDADEGADTDSSSDLFDLPNHDLDFYSSGLPVYETTYPESIKRGAPVSSNSIP